MIKGAMATSKLKLAIVEPLAVAAVAVVAAAIVVVLMATVVVVTVVDKVDVAVGPSLPPPWALLMTLLGAATEAWVEVGGGMGIVAVAGWSDSKSEVAVRVVVVVVTSVGWVSLQEGAGFAFTSASVEGDSGG